jgi:hypothetical protein
MNTRPIPAGYAETVHEAALVDAHNARFAPSKLERMRLALADAIHIIEVLDGRDNSCDPRTDIADLKAILKL